MEKTAAYMLPRMAQLDGLRAFAVACVLVDHWVGVTYHLGVDWGKLGVQLFYVLSGFLITGILLELREVKGQSRWFGARQFYIRRFLRIFPLFYATLGVTYLLGNDAVRQTLGWHVSYLSNAYICTLGYWPDYISHFWSLAVEEQFYLTWAWLILFLPHRWLLRVLLAFIYAAPLFRLGGSLLSANPISVYVLPVSSFDTLGIGALYALMSRYKNSKSFSTDQFARASGIVGVSVLLLLAVLPLIVADNPLVTTLQVGLKGTALALAYGWLVWRASSGFHGPVGALLQWRPIAYMGKISYGIYMFNPFMFGFLAWILSAVGLRMLIDVGLVRLLLLFLLTFGLATCSWEYFEGPINALRRHFRYHS